MDEGGGGRGAPGWSRREGALGALDVGAVAAGRAIDDGVLAHCGGDHELVAAAAADGAAVGLDREGLKAESGEGPVVSVAHDLVGLAQRGLAVVEAVGIHHDEFFDAHQAEARADLIAELGVLLKERHRKLFIAGDYCARVVGDHFFGGRREAEHLVIAVLDREHGARGLIVHPPARAFPQSLFLHDRHGGFEGARPGHLLGDHRPHLVEGALHERPIEVQPGPRFIDKTGAHQQAVAGDFGVGGVLTQGDEVHPAGAHGQVLRSGEA